MYGTLRPSSYDVQFVDVYVFATFSWNARSGTLFCSAETSVYVLYVEPAPAVASTFSAFAVTFGFFLSFPVLPADAEGQHGCRSSGR